MLSLGVIENVYPVAQWKETIHCPGLPPQWAVTSIPTAYTYGLCHQAYRVRAHSLQSNYQ